jgi:diacylglycerol kinase family enzyme
MYFYIYDQFLDDRKWHETLSQMEQKLSMLDVKGPVHKIHSFTKMGEIVKRALQRGATTIIAVGNDETLLQLINCIPKNVACGFISVEKDSYFSRMLNTNTMEESVEAIAGRKTISVNAGRIDSTLFLQKVELIASDFTAVINDSLILKVRFPQTLFTIVNPQLSYDMSINNGILDCTVVPYKKGLLSTVKKTPAELSKFYIKKMVLKSQTPIEVIIDGISQSSLQELTIRVVPKAVELITGKSISRQK